jgi:uncharacterized membrane protein YcaP (DUF421 family)
LLADGAHDWYWHIAYSTSNWKRVMDYIWSGYILVLALILTEYIQLKSDRLETLISGKAVTIIENGKISEKNLKKLR